MPTGAGSFPTDSLTVSKRREWLRGRGARGSATVEVAVVFPMFLLLVFAGVQAAEWYHVRSVCLAAADAGVRAGRVAGAKPTAGPAAAQAFLVRVDDSVADPAVSDAGSTPTLVRVQVSGSAPQVLPIPGLRLRVSQSAEAPREVLTAP